MSGVLNSKPITHVGIAGVGLMGEAIAWENVRHGFPVTLYAPDPQRLEEVRNRLLARSRTECTDPCPHDRVVIARSPTDLTACDLIIETIPEQARVKRRFYKSLGSDYASLLVTNTSSLRIGDLQKSVPHPRRFAGLHFCHPVVDRPLVEIAPGPQTDSDTVARLTRYIHQLGKRSLAVRDVPGFAVNQLLSPWLAEGVRLVQEGVCCQAIELAARSIGMPWGPVTQLDEIGLDVAVRVGQNLNRESAFPELLLTLYSGGYLGRKTGTGFLDYNTPSSTKPRQYSRPVTEWLSGQTLSFPPGEAEIRDRLLRPLRTESVRLLDEEVVSTPEEIATALRDGLGFTENPAEPVKLQSKAAA